MKNKLSHQDWYLMVGRTIVCDCGTPYEYVFKLSGIKKVNCYDEMYLLDEDDNKIDMNLCKPILRSITQLTENEKEEFNRLFGYYHYGYVFKSLEFRDFGLYYIYQRPYENKPCEMNVPLSALDWLTNIGIDVRGWIDVGLAIKDD